MKGDEKRLFGDVGDKYGETIRDLILSLGSFSGVRDSKGGIDLRKLNLTIKKTERRV